MVRNDIMQKLRRYCAYQERCHDEVRTKLHSLKVYGLELEEAVSQLVEEGFLNEERFARAYAGGKFRMRKWGRVKISGELKKRHISNYCIDRALAEIPEADYMAVMRQLIRSALQRYKQRDAFNAAGKTAAFMVQKGYEPDLVWREIKDITS